MERNYFRFNWSEIKTFQLFFALLHLKRECFITAYKFPRIATDFIALLSFYDKDREQLRHKCLPAIGNWSQFTKDESKWHSYDGFCGREKRKRQIWIHSPIHITQAFLFVFGAISFEWVEMLSNIRIWYDDGVEERNICVDPFFVLAPASISILGKMCWILAFTEYEAYLPNFHII